ncbi:MAG: diguanylate cyclase [Nitrospirae bacterium]|nr:diguanylate cyclase [Nitrospirota bacterium]
MPIKRILIVDDDPDILNVVMASLRSKDVEFSTASDGVEAVEKVFVEIPDLVILDVMMPKMNGYQVCRLLKNDRNTWQIPVIMLTVKAKDKDKLYAMSVGADHYIVKPFHASELKTKVAELLARPRRQEKSCPIENYQGASETGILSRVNALLDRKLQEMTFLQYMTRTMISTFDETSILDTALQGLMTDLGYHRVAIYMQEDDGNMRVRGSAGFPKQAYGQPFRLDDDEALATLMSRREPVLLDGGGVILRTDGKPDDYKGERQQCVIPLAARQEIRGLLLIERREGESPISEERVGVLQTLAVQMALALDNAAMYKGTLMLSMTDGLTGLYNSRYLYTKIEEEMVRARRYGHPLTLFMLDLDHFKDYNDEYGHLSGDDALRTIARVLRKNSRETDTVARYGGEEFSVILPETDIEKAATLAERIRAAVEAELMDPGEGRPKTHITVSIGVASMTEYVRKPEELVRMADSALYDAKAGGRNRVCRY